MAKVSVVVPVYNAERYLEKALRSLMVQTYKDMEIIVIDDGSTDHSPEIISRIMDEQSARIKMCSQANRGVGAARNLGLKLTNSEYVLFMDADDWVEKDFVETYLNSMMWETKCSVASSYFVTIGEKPEKVKKVNGEKILLFKAPAVWLRMFKTDFLRENKIEFGNYSIAEDLNFTGKAHLLINPKFTMTKRPLYHYYIRGGSAVSVSNEQQFDLLNAVRDLEEWAKERDCYEQNESFLEFMVINHVLMAGMKRAGEGNLLEEAIDKIIEFVDCLHPNWYTNKYIEMYTDEEEKEYLKAVSRMDRAAIKKFATHY